MQYKYARKLISTGDCFTCAGQWPFSKAIRWYTGDDVSHVGMAVWGRFLHESKDRLFMFEAMEGVGVQLIPLSTALSRYWQTNGKVFWHPLHVFYDGNVAAEYALQHWNEVYPSGYQFILGISPKLRFLRRCLGRSLDLKGMHCSELITHSVEASGFVPRKLPSLTTPGDVGRFECFRKRVQLLP